MAKKKGLGRGLGALIPTDAPNIPRDKSDQSSGLRMVPVAQIEPNPHQPRTEFDTGKLEELAESIKAHGLIQPLIVTQEEANKFYLIAGERRWRASQLAGLTELPVVVKEATPLEMLELAIIENVQRDDLNAVEEALAYRQLIDVFGLTQHNVAESVGKARSTIANLVRLLDLPPVVQQAVLNGQITGRHARELLRLETEDQMREMLQSIITFDWNVAQTVAQIDKRLVGKKPASKPKRSISANLSAVQSSFSERLGAPVKIDGNDSKGKIIIQYETLEELNSIYDLIVGDE